MTFNPKHYMYVEHEDSTPVRASIFEDGNLVAQWDDNKGLVILRVDDDVQS